MNAAALKAQFSSASDDWATPQDLFDRLNAKYGPFDLDVCASPENAKCASFYTKEQDGLAQPWTGRVWMNPPYGREIGKWVQYARDEAFVRQNAELVCMLLPARTDTRWWHDYVIPLAEVYFLRGRVKFGGHKNSAPFPSAVAVFRRAP